MVLCGVTLSLVACGGKSADEIADAINDAAAASDSSVARVTEPQAESATLKTACESLDAYGSEAADEIDDAIRQYAEDQKVLARFNLNQIDVEAADRLIEAMKDVDDSQKAADVSKLVC